MKKYLRGLMLLTGFISSDEVSAQMYGGFNSFYSNPGMYRFWEVDPYKNRFNEIGIVTEAVAPTCELDYSYMDDYGKVRNKTARGKAKLNYSVGLTVGSGIHLAKLSDNSALGLNINMMVLFTKVTVSNDNFKIKDAATFKEEIELLRTALPISLDYKTGAEAVSDMNRKGMFAFGAGIAPKLYTYGFAGGDAIPSITPFLKVEAGYFAGLAFKIRATYFVGDQEWDSNILYANVSNQQSLGYNSYSLSTGGELLISLIVMPYSRSWTD